MSEKEKAISFPVTIEAEYCDGCGCSLLVDYEDGTKVNVIALQFSVAPPHVAKQILGPFVDKTYRFCYQCCLRTLGATPPCVHEWIARPEHGFDVCCRCKLTRTAECQT